MLYKFGRLLQVAGLILLPVAIAGNLAPENALSLGQSMMLSGVGVVLFLLGRLLQNAGRAP